METQGTLDKLKAKIEPVLSEMGVELFDLSFVRVSKRLILRLLADKKKSITLDECTLINKKIGNLIEEEDLVSEKYTLEVSSPGLDRPLKVKKDFQRVLGEEVEIWASKAFSEKSYINGAVKAANEKNVVLSIKSGKELSIPYDQINKARRKF